jgi:predicted phage terminase large subunit-like protein
MNCNDCERPFPPTLLRDGICNECRLQAHHKAGADAEAEQRTAVLQTERSREAVAPGTEVADPEARERAEQAAAEDQEARNEAVADNVDAAMAAKMAAEAEFQKEYVKRRGRDEDEDPGFTRTGPPQTNADAARAELAQRQLCKRRLLPFVQRFTPNYMAGWFHVDLCKRLERFVEQVAKKESPRLMITVPPRHGKSTVASICLPAWALGQYPEWEFMCTSYSGDLAMRFSRQVREILRDKRYHVLFDTRLRHDTQGVGQWMTEGGGGLLAAGVGGPLTGSGAHILGIDDPVKNREEADSEQVRNPNWNWYTPTAYTRLAPGRGILVIQTRWHHDDLSGRLTQQMKDAVAELGIDNDEVDRWEIVDYPAIALEDEKYRKAGDSLHPERYDEKALARIRRAVGERDWWALYQQRPTPDEGAYITRDMVRFYRQHELPEEGLAKYGAFDLAIGQRELSDYTVGVAGAIDIDHNLYVLEERRGHWDADVICDEIVEMWKVHKTEVIGIEEGQIKQAIDKTLERAINKAQAWACVYEPLKAGRRDKVARGRTLQGMMRAGKVYLPHPDECAWVRDFLQELYQFPSGTFDDRFDALSWLAIVVADAPPPEIKPEPKKKSWKDKLAAYANLQDDESRRWQAS